MLKSGAAIPHLDEASATILSDCCCTAGCVEAKLYCESKSLLEDAMMKRAARLVLLKFSTYQTFFYQWKKEAAEIGKCFPPQDQFGFTSSWQF